MTAAALPMHEQERLQHLYDHALLNTQPQTEFDDITELAALICKTPVSLVTLVDQHRQWFLSNRGLSINETSRSSSFCAHAILEPDRTTIVEDARKDERFADNPLVTGDPKIAFYAGVPLVDNSGSAIGTLCVIDNKPRSLTALQLKMLKALAGQAVCHFELQKKHRELTESHRLLTVAYDEIERFSSVVAHDLRTPCSNMHMLSGTLLKQLETGEHTALAEQASWLKQASKELCGMIDGLLKHARFTRNDTGTKEMIDLKEMVAGICNLNGFASGIVTVKNYLFKIRTYRVPLQHILLNLILNAVRHNDNAKPKVSITCTQPAKGSYCFRVQDNGPGMSEELQTRAFDLFYKGTTTRETEEGSGIGLATVQSLINRLNGSIRIESGPGRQGTCFIFSIGA